MRDNFYHWFAVALLFSMFFGAEVVRASSSDVDLYNLGAFGGIGILSTVAALMKYKQAVKGEDND